ncbi:MAG: Ig-like domain-containing protein [Bacteroidales bacterium]|nr:Ig-like domain-containing protein [Bacteroidales bacterium]
MRLYRYILFFLFIPGFIGCDKDAEININSNDSVIKTEIIARINLTMKHEDVISKSTTVDDNVISNVNILVFDVNGNLLKNYYFENPSSMTISCSSGYKTIVAVANVGDIGFSSYTTIGNLRNAVTSNMTNSLDQCIMAGEKCFNLTNSGSITIEMIRLLSKITVVFNKEQLDEGTNVTIRDIRLRNVPSFCRLLSDNTPVTSSDISEYGDFIDANLEPSDHPYATPLYMFENMQGDIGYTTNESQKSPGDSYPVCSYIEISADYTNEVREGIIKYRFYLGNNITNNFDVIRNKWYQLNVVFREDAINEVSWRIDTSEINDVMYRIDVVAQPISGGSVEGAGYYKFNSVPDLSATPHTNYTFTGWSPSIAPVTRDMTYTANFQYIDPTVYVTGVTLSKDTLNLNSGSSGNLIANVLPINANNKSVVWSSSNPNVASVDQSGNVVGLSAGTASITVTTNDGGFTASCSVKVFRIIKLYFHVVRTAKVVFKSDDGGYWYLTEPMRDDIYVRSNSPEGIPGTISYFIEWAYDPSSGFPPPEYTSATKAIIIFNTLNKLLESGSAWGNDTDFNMNYPSITVTAVSPSIMANPPTKIIVDQDMNTYQYNETGK